MLLKRFKSLGYLKSGRGDCAKNVSRRGINCRMRRENGCGVYKNVISLYAAVDHRLLFFDCPVDC